MIRVLLVDDHAVMRAGFRMILEATGEIQVVGEAGTGAEAVAAATVLRPDVICMDVQMPDMDGIEATRRIVADVDGAPAVVIVTTFDRDDYLFRALSAGASGFVLKNAGPEELVHAVRVLAEGDALLAPEVTRRVIARFTRSEAATEPAASAPSTGAKSASPLETPAMPTVDLTEREAEVLRLVAQALSNAEIAQHLYIGEATVKTHVSNVLQKLGARDRVAAVVFAHRYGLA
ncbi:response regulator transcription factor [Microbacterium aquimaris]|uniref:response regulator transcription factor n=1 Tax=Microbacterium aquimaris TaxID=459816 RepID=UPI002AD4792F|nr:response regulator transcription factor [Microbacterium aquimaris]MDZ8275184.1 response regulator transcription factor [Microbacterium aquimaris]